MRHVVQADRRQVLEQLIFEFVPVDHQQDRRLVGLRRFEEQLGGLDHRVGFAAALRVPDEAASPLGVKRTVHHTVHGGSLMLREDKLVEFFLLLSK